MSMPIEDTVSQVDLPVIDISEFPEDLDAKDLSQLGDHPVLAKLREACKQWGCFQVVNHGVPVDLMKMADNFCRDLLSMPAETKERVSATVDAFEAYYRRPTFEVFRLPDARDPASVAQISAKICPEGNATFGETMANYSVYVSRLEKKITIMIIASLGLDANAFYHSHFGKCPAVFRINRYPPENISIGEVALTSHTDIGCLGILQNDDGGGLQIRSQEGDWVNVKTLPRSFVVFVGDSFKAWSNGRYHSAEHRVVYCGWTDRISIAFLSAFSDDTEIWAPEEVLDKNNTRRYKPFIYSQLKKHVVRVEVKEKAMALQQMAGI